MTIGAALLLIAVGAILRFAISTVSTHGVDLHTIGDILMIVGAVGLLLWLFVWGPWSRGRRSSRAATTEDRTYDRRSYDGQRPARDPYPPSGRAPYRGETEPLPPERSYQDPYR